MQNPLNIAPAFTVPAADEVVALGVDLIANGGLTAIKPALSAIMHAGLTPTIDDVQPLVAEAVFQLLGAFEDDLRSPEAHAVIASLDPAIATAAMSLLFIANFSRDDSSIEAVSDATVICLAALTGAAGQRDDARHFLRSTRAERDNPLFLAAAHDAHCHILRAPAGIEGLWLEPFDYPGDTNAALAAIDARPLDLAAHRALVRYLAEQGDPADALAKLLVALALPISDSEKSGLAADLAILSVYLRTIGRQHLLDAYNARFTYAACLDVMRDAVAKLSNIVLEGAWEAIEIDVIVHAAAQFESYVRHAPPAYPLIGGKPYIDVVWLEITNFCNQKCTFCPDMHREDKRQWLPLEQVKNIIDQLAESVSVGSMQLNAYGEPLLHPNIAEILTYIREKKLPFPTFFTTHGMTLVDKKLAQLSHNYPSGIAVSLHNDSQDSYSRTRSDKIGDYKTLVHRLTALMTQMVHEGAPTHLRLYQMVCNGNEDKEVPPEVRAGFADSAERMLRHVRKWETIATRIAQTAPAERQVRVMVNSWEHVQHCFAGANTFDGDHLPIMAWRDEAGCEQVVFISPRSVGTYANLLLEYHPTWTVERRLINKPQCGFAKKPSLSIFATGKLGICCLDMNSTAIFGSLADFGSIRDALESVEAKRIFAQLSNGVATSRGCQICLASDKQLCGPTS